MSAPRYSTRVLAAAMSINIDIRSATIRLIDRRDLETVFRLPDIVGARRFWDAHQSRTSMRLSLEIDECMACPTCGRGVDT